MKSTKIYNLSLKYTFLLILCLIITSNSFSQINEGHFQFSIKVTAMDTTLETKQKVGMMYNSNMNLYFTDTMSRIDFAIGSVFATSLIVDNKNKVGINLSSNPNGKFAVPLTNKDIDIEPKAEDNVKVKLINEKKVILGYNCKKAVIEQAGVETTYWYTDEIKIEFIGNSIMNKNIPGFPLYFSTIAEGMLMEYEVSNYEFDIINEALIFSMAVPPGYHFVGNR